MNRPQFGWSALGVGLLALGATGWDHPHHRGRGHVGVPVPYPYGYSSPMFVGIGPNGPFGYVAPFYSVGTGGPSALSDPDSLFGGANVPTVTDLPSAVNLPGPVFGPNLGLMGASTFLIDPTAAATTRRAQANRGAPAAPVRRADPGRSVQLLTLGDRLFRARNTRVASDRYQQALRADPHAAAPRIKLAQIALVRGRYAEAANLIREALTSQPAWLATAPDIQAIYAEPADFTGAIARLEAHLQAQPADRDAWLVLGAQYYLSGQTRKAHDVFVRLSDRQGDPVIDTFLIAAAPDPAPPPAPGPP